MKNRKALLLTISSLVLSGCALPSFPDLSIEKEQSSSIASEESSSIASEESSSMMSELSSDYLSASSGDYSSSITSESSLASSLGSNSSSNSQENSRENYPPYLTIPQEIVNAANEEDYSFDPTQVLIKEEEVYDFDSDELRHVAASSDGRLNRDTNLVYYFEGSYAEGYQADYSLSYGFLHLWDDGIFTGKIRDTSIKGYWYNSSIANGSDSSGDIKDCLELVSNISHYEFMSAYSTDGFYSFETNAYLNMGWGTRTMPLNGYYYYPTVGVMIDFNGVGGKEFKVGDYFNSSALVAMEVFSNLSYKPVYRTNNLRWTIPTDMLDSRNRFIAAGNYDISIQNNGFFFTDTITVTL